ncbi:MAG: type III-B CRISPR module RAMP protein Cmr6 [Ignavibacteriaceae bacterium]|nr:type III-B CRISPR module RAMP protein Cmr6 [Ignavibacteriaceae bacterium]
MFNANLEPTPQAGIGNNSFELTTIYPGLLIGSGFNHEIGEQKNELKLGFFFDHTTGLPCIPGSSVKGVLRDACEKAEGEYVLEVFKEIKDKQLRDWLIDADAKKIFLKNGQRHSQFVLNVFNGKSDNENYIPLKKRDIFFDAFPTKSFNESGKFLANDYITPHPDPLKSPNPIQFLKVLPQVTFQFNFRLTDECCPAKIKEELFRQILLDLGVGAKTNVGYGQFIPYNENVPVTQNNTSGTASNTNQEGNPSVNVDVNLSRAEKYKAKVIEESNGYLYFQFEANDKVCSVKKKIESANKKLKKNLIVGDAVLLVINHDYKRGDSDINFQVFPSED